ncbi:MAG: hypothetical protein WD851_15585 [Pirellulales bacterium]
MSQTIQPPFVEPPPFIPAVQSPVVQPAVRVNQASQSPRPPHRPFPWLPILAGFAAGWLVAQVPLPKVARDAVGVVASVKYTPEQRAVLEWVNDNVGEPDIEIIKFDQRANADGLPIVTLKYRGEWMGGSRMVWTRVFQVENGIANQVSAR